MLPNGVEVQNAQRSLFIIGYASALLPNVVAGKLNPVPRAINIENGLTLGFATLYARRSILQPFCITPRGSYSSKHVRASLHHETKTLNAVIWLRDLRFASVQWWYSMCLQSCLTDDYHVRDILSQGSRGLAMALPRLPIGFTSSLFGGLYQIFSSLPWFPREIHRVVRPSLDTVEQHFTVTPITSAVGHVHGSDIPSYPIFRYLLHVLYILPVEGQVALNISLPDS